MKTFDLLKTFSEVPGPSGFENQISSLVKDTWGPLVNEVTIDRLGSVVATKLGDGHDPRPKILVAAHLDEIGLMVKAIEGNRDGLGGFIRVTSIGGIDPRHLYGQRVTIHGSKSQRQDLPGIIGSLPPQMLEGDGASGDLTDLVVDPGLSLEKLKRLVAVGDPISFRQPINKLLNKRVAGKALDNRISLVVITKCLEKLKRQAHYWDVIAVATAQEETVLLGSYTTAHRLKPDLAIALDVTFASGPGITDDSAFALGDGPTNSIGPNMHPGIFKSLNDAADRIELKVHVDPQAGMSGTDAVALQIAREGIPTGLISVPVRYMHLTCETASIVDINNAARWLAEYISELDNSYLADISESFMKS